LLVGPISAGWRTSVRFYTHWWKSNPRYLDNEAVLKDQLSGNFLQFFGNPDLDDGLPGHA
jgi:hypothetical protein